MVDILPAMGIRSLLPKNSVRSPFRSLRLLRASNRCPSENPGVPKAEPPWLQQNMVSPIEGAKTLLYRSRRCKLCSDPNQFGYLLINLINLTHFVLQSYHRALKSHSRQFQLFTHVFALKRYHCLRTSLSGLVFKVLPAWLNSDFSTETICQIYTTF